MLAILALGCAQTAELAKQTASYRTGTGIGQVVGDKVVSEFDHAVNNRNPPPQAGPGAQGAPAGRVVTASAGGGAFQGGDAACAQDPHCLTPGDAILCRNNHPYGDHHTCFIAAAIKEPSADTKQQGEFIAKSNGSQFWSDEWVRTRPVKQGEKLTLGQYIVYIENGQEPGSHAAALNAPWRLGRITDMTDAFKGEVRTSRNQNARLAAARVVVAAGIAERTK